MDEGLLIALVEQHPNIFDKKRPDFKDARKKENSWLEIANAMDCTPEECQRVWLNLRTRYSKELRKRNEVPSGAASQVEEDVRWVLFNNLHFLQSHIKARKSCTNIKRAAALVPEDPATSSCSTSRSSSTMNMWDSVNQITGSPSFDEELVAEHEETAADAFAPCTSATTLAVHVVPKQVQTQEPAQEPAQEPDGAPKKKRKTAASGLEDKLCTTAEALSAFLKEKNNPDSNDALAQSVASSLREMTRHNRNKAKIEIMKILDKYDVPYDVDD